MNLQAIILAVIVAAAPCAGHADAGSIPQEQTDAIVAKFQSAYADTFDRRDAKGMAALLTDDATLQNEWGDVTRGRTNIESLLMRLMAQLQTGTKLEDTSLVSQSVAADTIVSQGISRRLVPGADPVQMFFTRVLVLQGGEWKLAATQIARPSAAPKPVTPTPAK